MKNAITPTEFSGITNLEQLRSYPLHLLLQMGENCIARVTEDAAYIKFFEKESFSYKAYYRNPDDKVKIDSEVKIHERSLAPHEIYIFDLAINTLRKLHKDALKLFNINLNWGMTSTISEIITEYYVVYNLSFELIRFINKCYSFPKDLNIVKSLMHLDSAIALSWGVNYCNGSNGFERNDEKGAYFFHLSAAQGHVKAQNALGSRYYDGSGVKQDRKEAMRLYHLAANQGDIFSQYNLAREYKAGRYIGKNIGEAVRFFRLAAIQGHIISRTVHLLQLDRNQEREVGFLIAKAEEEAKAEAEKLASKSSI